MDNKTSVTMVVDLKMDIYNDDEGVWIIVDDIDRESCIASGKLFDKLTRGFEGFSRSQCYIPVFDGVAEIGSPDEIPLSKLQTRTFEKRTLLVPIRVYVEIDA